jgi:predicted aconitase
VTIELEALDQALLDGVHGAASANAMRMLVRYGEVVGAERFVSIGSAHIDGCLYHGPSSIDFIRRYADLGGRVRVPTTLNVAAVDVVHPGWHRGAPELPPAQAELTRLHEVLGCLPTLTCAPYQRMLRPLFGEHVAWAESNAIVFVNSVLGARTDRYGDFTDLCAALTGRVPYAGLHRDENRWATVVVEVPQIDATALPRDIYFACLGYVLGAMAAGRVPLLVGVDKAISEDEMKALGSAGASSGALALFHIAGVTPEAPSVEVAVGPAAETPASIKISIDDLHAAQASLSPVEVGEPIAAVCLGTPHFSLAEFAGLAGLLHGRTLAAGVEFYVSTSREIAAEVADNPRYAAIAEFGTRVVVDTCTYLAPVVRQTRAAILTNSAKWAHYGPGNLNRRAGLVTLDRCVRSAELGRVVA